MAKKKAEPVPSSAEWLAQWAPASLAALEQAVAGPTVVSSQTPPAPEVEPLERDPAEEARQSIANAVNNAANISGEQVPVNG